MQQSYDSSLSLRIILALCLSLSTDQLKCRDEKWKLLYLGERMNTVKSPIQTIAQAFLQ
jgi:hypothetical protein